MRSLAAVPARILLPLLVITPSLAVATQDIFLAIPGLDGGSADAQFPGAFEALSVSSGFGSQSGGSGGGGTGKPTFSSVDVKLRTSAASPGLEQAAVTGTKFPQAVVSFRRSGERGFVFLTYTLTDVGATSFKREADASGDAPSESVSLTYAQIKTEYRQQKADGSPGPITTVCWDVRTNAPCP
jgi:type VI secretion system secreted protein Hcp